jgi:hypothetical protein
VARLRTNAVRAGAAGAFGGVYLRGVSIAVAFSVRAPAEVRRLEEAVAAGQPMEERLLQAAARIERAGAPAPGQLRAEQARVFAAFAMYLEDLATRPRSGGAATAPPFCRIILPPRTGKTVIAGHIIDRTGLTATFIVPTRALVEQTVRELARRAPGVAIGTYCGERKLVVAGGINVITYAMLHLHAAELPPEIARSALVFVDEAHHAMTPGRMAILAHRFDPLAVRVALTATPDYGAERRLESFFPELIHEITLDEALALDLLAPLRVWVAEVDADASSVRFLAGDFDADLLGRLMSTAPFFRAVEVFRYDPDHARMPCLIACASRQQAHDLVRYLERHRPPASPAPALLLGDTPREDRERALARFEAGELDTLVQVGVLVEGWSSPRCKLLIDLAPSASRVRATQKYFRVMTRHGDDEARIFVLLPGQLPALPILPVDLFGGLVEYQCGALVGAGSGKVAPIQRTPGTPVEGVELRSRILLTTRHEKPALDPAAAAEIRAVLASNPDFAPEACGVFRFAGLWFDHPLFVGRGDFLLRWLGVPLTRDAYHRFVGRLYPEAAANLLLSQDGWRTAETSCSDDRRHLLRALCAPAADPRGEEPFLSTWRAVAGPSTDPSGSPEDLYIARQTWDLVVSLLPRLKPRQRALLIGRFGLFGCPPHTLAELAARAQICVQRTRQIVNLALRKLYWWAHFADVAPIEPAPAWKALQRYLNVDDAMRVRYLTDLHARAPAVWAWAERAVMSPSSRDHTVAVQRLRDLREAAELDGARPRFEACLARLRASTSKRKAFWDRWSAAERASCQGADEAPSL